MGLLKGLIFIAEVIILTAIVCFFVVYLVGRADSDAKLKFKQFLRLYSIAPENWIVDGDVYFTVVYYNSQMYTKWIVTSEYYFSVIDSVRFIFWKHNLAREDERKVKREVLEETVKAWQFDIREYCKEHGIPTNDL